MSNYNELPVYKATYDLLLEMFKFTKDFSKEYKYTVGDSLKKETIELITLIYRANSRKDKHATLQTAREQGYPFTNKTHERHTSNKLKKICGGESTSRKCIKANCRMAKKPK